MQNDPQPPLVDSIKIQEVPITPEQRLTITNAIFEFVNNIGKKHYPYDMTINRYSFKALFHDPALGDYLHVDTEWEYDTYTIDMENQRGEVISICIPMDTTDPNIHGTTPVEFTHFCFSLHGKLYNFINITTPLITVMTDKETEALSFEDIMADVTRFTHVANYELCDINPLIPTTFTLEEIREYYRTYGVSVTVDELSRILTLGTTASQWTITMNEAIRKMRATRAEELNQMRTDMLMRLLIAKNTGKQTASG